MARVGFMTYGELHEAYDHPSIADFLPRVDASFGQAYAADGFLAAPDAYDDGPWTPHRYPAFPGEPPPAADHHPIQTLSVWRDLEAVSAYAYSGEHLAALRNRRAWFRKIDAPGYVAWWIADDHTPSWAEGCERLEHLHAHGPTPYAFTFRHAFDPHGNPVALARPNTDR